MPIVRKGMGPSQSGVDRTHLLRGRSVEPLGAMYDWPPVFIANEEWEHGSIYEPNLIYHDGKWKMWYVSGSNEEDYLVHGYAESDDGSAGWSKHKVFAPPEMKMFDFCVRQRGELFDAIFARVWLRAGTPPGK